MTSRGGVYSFLPPIEYVPVQYEGNEGPGYEYVPVLYESDGYDSSGSPGNNGNLSDGSAGERTRLETLKLTLTDSEFSRCASIFQDVMTGIVFISILNLMLCTVPELIAEGWGHFFDMVELMCTVAFTLEVVLRVWAASDRLYYLQSGDNVLDVVAAMPLYIECMAGMLLLPSSPMHHMMPSSIRRVSAARGERFVNTLQGLRILRLFKAMRQFETVTLVLESIRGSFQGLAVLLTFICFGTLLSATIIYYVELDEPGTRITSIPAACWWSIATITGVGYGDLVPETPVGKLGAALFMVSGLLLTSVSVAIITSSFIEQYQRNQVMLRVQKKVERPHGSTKLSQPPVPSGVELPQIAVVRAASEKSQTEKTERTMGDTKSTPTNSSPPPLPPMATEVDVSPNGMRRHLSPRLSLPDLSHTSNLGSPGASPRSSLDFGTLARDRDKVFGESPAHHINGPENVVSMLLRLETELTEVLVVLETMAERVEEQAQDKEAASQGRTLGSLPGFHTEGRRNGRTPRSSQLAAVGLLRNQLKGWFRHAEHVAESVVSKAADLEAEAASQGGHQPPAHRRAGSAYMPRLRPSRQSTFG
eukprot:CAMPEP_0178393714 /NCGR_PEP_ID=MMETSP0689_2-20121128/12329_1 /TAXON_ID=160604 /ORGANISM="Amphidinium massartii, Strain CS-259" /LENGTH=589 /DNA_ID=CAMNT_0020014313 /DNA_START=109 /DNA_END=1878 /DNA_ORIENTATION=+